jgi:hypothetical protein
MADRNGKILMELVKKPGEINLIRIYSVGESGLRY